MSEQSATPGKLPVVVLTGTSAGCDKESVQGILENFHTAAAKQEHCARVGRDACLSRATYLRHSHIFAVREEAIAHVECGVVRDAAVFIVPGGNLWGKRGMVPVLGDAGQRAMADAVHNGSVYIGICAGAFLACDIKGLGLGKVRYNAPGIFGCCEEGAVSGTISLKRGALASDGLPKNMCDSITPMLPAVKYYDGPLLEVLPDQGAFALARYDIPVEQRGNLARRWARFGSFVQGSAAAVVFRAGRGAAVLVSPHPELTDAAHIEEVLPGLASAALQWIADEHTLAPAAALPKLKKECACGRSTLWSACPFCNARRPYTDSELHKTKRPRVGDKIDKDPLVVASDRTDDLEGGIHGIATPIGGRKMHGLRTHVLHAADNHVAADPNNSKQGTVDSSSSRSVPRKLAMHDLSSSMAEVCTAKQIAGSLEKQAPSVSVPNCAPAGEKAVSISHILRSKAIIEHPENATSDALLTTLRELKAAGSLPTSVLSDTKIGLVVNQLIKNTSLEESVRESARQLLASWREAYRQRKATTRESSEKLMPNH